MNLLNNGADASLRPLDVYAYCTTQQLRICIDDYGPGIAPELLSKLGDQAISGRWGAGLGALLAKAAVERLEWEHIQRVLQEHEGNISATARALRMHRRTLQRKLAKRPVRE